MNKSPIRIIKELLSELSLLSCRLLHVGLPTVLLYLCALLAVTVSASRNTPSYLLAHKYAPALEHIVMALTITVIGAAVADIAERSQRQDR